MPALHEDYGSRVTASGRHKTSHKYVMGSLYWMHTAWYVRYVQPDLITIAAQGSVVRRENLLSPFVQVSTDQSS